MLPPHLKKYFWDTDFDALNSSRYRYFVVERLLELGDEDACHWMRENFSRDEILAVLQKNRRLSKRSLNFWNLVLNH